MPSGPLCLGRGGKAGELSPWGKTPGIQEGERERPRGNRDPGKAETRPKIMAAFR